MDIVERLKTQLYGPDRERELEAAREIERLRETIMDTWKDRVEEEMKDLLGRITKLERFLRREPSSSGIDVSEVQRVLLVAQLGTMRTYAQILKMRLEE